MGLEGGKSRAAKDGEEKEKRREERVWWWAAKEIVDEREQLALKGFGSTYVRRCNFTQPPL